MAKITRAVQKIFGFNAGLDQIAEFGSLAAGSPTFTTDPVVIQSLSNFTDGWFAAVLGNNSPAIEDMNALCFLYAYQLAYLMQEGIAEWDATTTYYIGSMVNASGVIYISLTDNNLNNAVTDAANWTNQSGAIKTKTANYTLLVLDGLIKADASSGAFTLTIPAATGNPGKEFKIKKIDSSENAVTIARTGADLIDGETSQLLQGAMAGITLKSDGISNWYVF